MYSIIRHKYFFPAPIKLRKLFTFSILYHFVITQEIKSEKNIFGSVTKYLQQYSDINIGSIVFADEKVENDIEIRQWYDQLTFMLQGQVSNSFPFVYTGNAFKDSAMKLKTVLSRNRKASLVVADMLKISHYSSNPLSFLSEELLRGHVWLFLYPYYNITEYNLRSLAIFRHLQDNKNLKFDSQASYLVAYILRMLFLYLLTSFVIKPSYNARNISLQVYLLSGLYEHAKLFELYHACKTSPLSTKLIKEFHTGIKTVYTKTDYIWSRRQDFLGCTLKVTYFEDNPIIWTVKNNSFTMKESEMEHNYLVAGNSIMLGTQIELFANLMKNLNFSVEWLYERGHMYGTYNQETQSWSGIVGQLERGEAEMSIFQLYDTSSRRSAVTFSIPIDYNDYGLYMQKPRQSLTWSTFVKVFSIDYWVTVVFVAIICWMFLFLLFQWVDVGELKKNDRKWGSRCMNVLMNIGSGLSVVVLSFGQHDVNQGRELEYSSKHSMKILYFTVCMFGTLNYMVWGAGLTSTLTVHSFELPINSLESLLDHTGFQLVILRGSAVEAYFSEAAGPIAKGLWERSIKNNENAFVRSTEDQEKAVLEDRSNVVFADTLSVNLWRHFPCKIATTSTRYYRHSTAYPFRKNSTYINAFNSALNRMMETGSLNRIHRNSQKFRPLTNCKEEQELAIGYQNILSAFVLSTVGFAIAILIWVLEFSCIKLYKVNGSIISDSNSKLGLEVENYEDNIITISRLVRQLGNSKVIRHKEIYIDIINNLRRKLDDSDMIASE